MAGEPISSNYLQFTTNTSKNQGGVTLADFKELKKLDCREVARREGLEPNRQEKIRCFLHTGDNTPSLQLYEDGWHCFGCGEHGDAVDLVARYRGISVEEAAERLSSEFGLHTPTNGEKPHFEAEFFYKTIEGQALKKIVWRYRNGKKETPWYHKTGDSWAKGASNLTPLLYDNGIDSPGFIYVAEGEKCVTRLGELGIRAVTLPGGAQSPWKDFYTQTFKGLDVIIVLDNDDPGRKYGNTVATNTYTVAKSVKVLDLSKAWTGIPPKGDVADLIDKFGTDEAAKLLYRLESETPEWRPATDDPFLSCFKPLSAFEEKEASWLVPGWIPQGQITLTAADGGVGKTSLWCNLVAAISRGQRCVLDPPGYQRTPQVVAFLTTEDSVRQKLKKKLRLAGACMENIITPDFAEDRNGALRGLKFGSSEMERFVRYFRPALCVFDPVQGFVPAEINMGSRNAMRDCMAPLVALGEETGTTFLVICHTNKRKGAWGRDRIADSADLWDISRSVLMAGYTEDQGVRYLSNEKNNYTELHETLLFTIDSDGQIQEAGSSWKRDREYIQECTTNTSPTKRDDCKEWILSALDEAGGNMPSKEIEDRAKAAGYAFRTIRRAKDELKKDGTIEYYATGSAREGNRTWHIKKADSFTELPDDTGTPWTA